MIQSKHGAARMVVGLIAVDDIRTSASQREAPDPSAWQQRHAPRRIRSSAIFREAILKRSHRRVARRRALRVRVRRRRALDDRLVPSPLCDERHATRHHHARLDRQRLVVEVLGRQQVPRVVHARERMHGIARDGKRRRRRQRLLRRRGRPAVSGVVAVHRVHVPVRRVDRVDHRRRRVLGARRRPRKHPFLIFAVHGDAQQVTLGGGYRARQRLARLKDVRHGVHHAALRQRHDHRAHRVLVRADRRLAVREHDRAVLEVRDRVVRPFPAGRIAAAHERRGGDRTEVARSLVHDARRAVGDAVGPVFGAGRVREAPGDEADRVIAVVAVKEEAVCGKDGERAGAGRVDVMLPGDAQERALVRPHVLPDARVRGVQIVAEDAGRQPPLAEDGVYPRLIVIVGYQAPLAPTVHPGRASICHVVRDDAVKRLLARPFLKPKRAAVTFHITSARSDLGMPARQREPADAHMGGGSFHHHAAESVRSATVVGRRIRVGRAHDDRVLWTLLRRQQDMLRRYDHARLAPAVLALAGRIRARRHANHAI